MEKNSSNNLKVNDRLLSIEKHGWKELRRASITILVIYIAIKPYSASIFIMEYFKLDPELTYTILVYALPLLIGILLARLMTAIPIIIRYVLFHIYYTLIFLVPAFLILPIFFICRSSKNEKIIRFKNRLSDYIQKKELRLEKDNKKYLEKEKQKPEQTHIYKSNLALFLIIFIILFSAQFYDNIVGKTWNPKFNKKYEILTNLHYNCQITGGYNIDECDYWKKHYKEYKLAN